MSVLRRAKLRTPDGTESIEYPLGVEAENVEVANQENLSQRLVRIDEDLEKNEEDIAAVSELAGTNKQNIGAAEVRIDALEGRSASVDKKPYYFDTVADMAAYQQLIEGDMVITLGYYTKNDGGGANFIIVNSANSLTPQIKLNNNLYASIISDYLIPEMLGAKGDGVSDDSSAFTNCFKTNLPIICSKDKIYAISHVELNNSNIYLDGQGCTFKNIKLDMSEWREGLYSFSMISSMFADNIDKNSPYSDVIFKNFTIDQNSDNVTGLNNEMHWGGLFTPFLLWKAENIYIDNVKVINTLQTPFYFFDPKKINCNNSFFYNIGFNRYLDTGSRNCFEMGSTGSKLNCIFNATNLICEKIHDEIGRFDNCSSIKIDNSTFKSVYGTIVEKHHNLNSEKTPDFSLTNISNCSLIDCKGLIHVNDETNLQNIVNINNIQDYNADGISNFYGHIYGYGNVIFNINNIDVNYNVEKYTQGFIHLVNNSKINISNSNITSSDSNVSHYLIRCDNNNEITISNCIINIPNFMMVNYANNGSLTINNSILTVNRISAGIYNYCELNKCKIISSILSGSSCITGLFNNGTFKIINTEINISNTNALSLIELNTNSTLKTLVVNGLIINSSSTARIRFAPVTDFLQFINNIVDADSSAFTDTRALQNGCLSSFIGNICKGSIFKITGTPTINANNYNFTFIE